MSEKNMGEWTTEMPEGHCFVLFEDGNIQLMSCCPKFNQVLWWNGSKYAVNYSHGKPVMYMKVILPKPPEVPEYLKPDAKWTTWPPEPGLYWAERADGKYVKVNVTQPSCGYMSIQELTDEIPIFSHPGYKRFTPAGREVSGANEA